MGFVIVEAGFFCTVRRNDFASGPRPSFDFLAEQGPRTYTETRTQRGRMRSGMHFRRHRFRQTRCAAEKQNSRPNIPPPSISNLRGRNMCTDIERSRTPPASIFAETETKRIETFPRICVKWKSSRKNCYSFPTRIKDAKSKTFKRKIFYQQFTGIFCQKFSMLTRRSPV